ncbi:major facilitator superfamily domain-containing protein [Dendryphion nanum]|uniref:Major facilitator superfamily domain-containing protein n=1 Tax=Dendryphion nanum TaxID=256645 RepID=A0A9P9I7B7_9PLEO|nr:major facilitator superfamily domain-containing protein [Dendryphion nanum]
MATTAPSVPPAEMSRLKLVLVMIGLCLAVFLTGMDQTILATAAPTISDEFHTVSDIAWWTDIYLLTLSSFQLFYGKLYTLFPIKPVYIVAIVLFEIGSLICTTAPDSAALISGRAIAGVGASGIFSGGVLITTKLIPLAKRPAYLGIMSAIFGLAAIVGPFIGGALADRSTWRWCFGINLPLGAATIIICMWLVHTPDEPTTHTMSLREKLEQFDIVGMTLTIFGLVCLLLGLQWGGSKYEWKNGRVIALLVMAGILLAAFALLQRTDRASKVRTIPRSIAKDYNIWFAATYAIGITGGIYVALVYLPLWFQIIRNKTALTSGILLTPTIAGYVIASVVAGAITSATGYYNISMILGTILLIPGSALLTTLKPHTSTSRLIGFEVLYGLGAGFGFGQPSYIVQTLLPEPDVPIGVTFITLVQNLSASIFVAVGQSVFRNRLHQDLGSLIPGGAMLDSGASHVLSLIPPIDRPRAFEAYSDALIHTIYISLALACTTVVGAISVKWQSMKATKTHQSPELSEEPQTDPTSEK